MVADLAVLVLQKMFTIQPSVEWLQLFKFAFVICIINKIGKAFGGYNYVRSYACVSLQSLVAGCNDFHCNCTVIPVHMMQYNLTLYS